MSCEKRIYSFGTLTPTALLQLAKRGVRMFNIAPWIALVIRAVLKYSSERMFGSMDILYVINTIRYLTRLQ